MSEKGDPMVLQAKNLSLIVFKKTLNNMIVKRIRAANSNRPGSKAKFLHLVAGHVISLF